MEACGALPYTIRTCSYLCYILLLIRSLFVAFLSGVQSGHEATAAHLAVQPLLAKSVSEFVCLKLQQSQLIKRRNM